MGIGKAASTKMALFTMVRKIHGPPKIDGLSTEQDIMFFFNALYRLPQGDSLCPNNCIIVGVIINAKGIFMNFPAIQPQLFRASLKLVQPNQSNSLYKHCQTAPKALENQLISLKIDQDSPELLKVEDVRTHVCAIFSRICAKFVLYMRERKNKHFFMILAQFDKI